MSATTVKLLQSAADIVGGNRALARHLGVGEALLARFIADSRELPDTLLLRAVDIILADRHSRLSEAGEPPEFQQTRLQEVVETPQNPGRGNGTGLGEGPG